MILAIVYSGPKSGHHHDQASRDLEASGAAVAYPSIMWYPAQTGWNPAWPTTISRFPAAVVLDAGVIRVVSGVTAADLPALHALPAEAQAPQAEDEEEAPWYG